MPAADTFTGRNLMTSEKKDKLCIVMFSGDLEKALAGFMLSTTAASMGMEVKMFFTFWGLNIVKQNHGSLHSDGIMEKMLNTINRGGSKRLKLGKFHMLGMGTWMMKKLMKKNRIPSVDEFIDIARDLGVEMIACTTSCGVMGLTESSFRPQVTVHAGAAYFLGEAKEAKITLFI
jgi:peroxiredoxin family protein